MWQPTPPSSPSSGSPPPSIFTRVFRTLFRPFTALGSLLSRLLRPLANLKITSLFPFAAVTMGSVENGEKGGAVSVTVGGILWDMDGTLLDSTPGVLATWERYAEEFNLDLSHVLKTSHGQRTVDNMKIFCGMDQAAAEAETERFENMIVAEAQRLQAAGERGLQILPGVHDILTKLNSAPKPVWSIVTSATNKYASAALPTAGIPAHPALVTADDVTQGKPNPDPYLMGAAKLGLDPKDCIVVEDAPTGIRSGVAAGCKTLAVCTSHKREELEGLGATWIVDDLTHVDAEIVDGKVRLVIHAHPH